MDQNWRRSGPRSEPSSSSRFPQSRRTNDNRFERKQPNRNSGFRAPPSVAFKVGDVVEGRVNRVDQRMGSFVEFTSARGRGLLRDVHLDVDMLVQVRVHVVHPNGNLDLLWAPPASPPLGDPSRPLIILDLNGVILDRDKYERRNAKAPGRGYVKRNHCDQFIRFCFQHFNVGIWSCGKRKNMELQLFKAYEASVLFVFDQFTSTNLWPQRSVVSPEKPLFLKELTKVWELHPQFNASNTILVDNHVEKFQRNPMGTCMLIPEFKNSAGNDDLLDPRGPLCKLLAQMAKCPDVPQFMLDNPCSYFPTEYPVSPPAPEGEEAPGRGPQAREPRSGGANQHQLRRELAALFTSSEMMKRNCPERDVEFYMRHKDTPGPRAVPFGRKHFATCATDPTGWVVCEKTDGIRSLLFAPTSGGVYLVDRAWQFTPFSLGEASQNVDLMQLNAVLTRNRAGSTLLDGEIIRAQDGNVGFLVFDAVWCCGVDVGSCPSLEDRVSAARELVSAAAEQLDANMQLKAFLPINQVAKLEPYVHAFPYPGIGEVDCDGLVITPSRKAYYEYTVLKYKPKHHLTVDFKVYAANLDDEEVPITLMSYIKSNRGFGKRGGGTSSGEVQISAMRLSADERRQVREQLAQLRGSDSVILECTFDELSGFWRYRNARLDKARPNSVGSAWHVMESIAENVGIQDFVREWTDLDMSVTPPPRPPPKQLSGSAPAFHPASRTSQVQEAAQHYNERQQARNQNEKLRDDIYALRKLNNWAKAVMINEWCSEVSPSGGAFVLREATSPVECPPALQQAAGRPPHVRARAKPKQRGVNVLDVACGRGGDLLKWTSDREIDCFVGVDVAGVALQEAEKRIGQRHQKSNPKRVAFIEADAADPNLVSMIAERCGATTRFDYVSMQFAIHYLCDEASRCTHFFASMAQVIRPGGRLLVSTTDSQTIEARTQATGRFNNSVSSVVMKAANVSCDDFGVAYKFTLGDAVVDCEEYIVPFNKLKQVASAHGFRLLYAQNLSHFVADAMVHKDYASLLRTMKVNVDRGVSASEWEVIQLYMVVVFEKSVESGA